MPHVTPLQADDPRRVGRYRLTGRIASQAGADGDTQRVFMAKMVDDGTVIVTLLGGERVADAAARDRFTAEARVARRVAPFCAARILDAGIEHDEPYLVAEYVPGPTLTEAVGHEGPMPPATLEALAIGTATGLMAIHQTGLVHGRLGPDHVVLGPDGPRVTHFGITPPYGAATPAADLGAWANTVIFAAVGRRPVGRQDLDALPDDLRDIVAACLAPDLAARPVARTVLTRLLRGHDLSSGLLTEGTRQARPAARTPASTTPVIRQPAPIRSRSGVIIWVVACAVCVIAIVVAAVFVFRPRPGPTASTTATPRVNATQLPRPLASASSRSACGSPCRRARPRGPSPTRRCNARASSPSSRSGTARSPWTRRSAAGGATALTGS
jgi:serine/threonine protein kinase